MPTNLEQYFIFIAEHSYFYRTKIIIVSFGYLYTLYCTLSNVLLQQIDDVVYLQKCYKPKQTQTVHHAIDMVVTRRMFTIWLPVDEIQKI